MQQRRNTTDSSKCEEAYSNRHLYFSQRVSVARRTLRQLRLSANSRLLTTLRCFVREIPAPSRRAELGDAADDYTSIFINQFFPFSLHVRTEKRVAGYVMLFSLFKTSRAAEEYLEKPKRSASRTKGTVV
jgi:hypothetical protein